MIAHYHQKVGGHEGVLLLCNSPSWQEAVGWSGREIDDVTRWNISPSGIVPIRWSAYGTFGCLLSQLRGIPIGVKYGSEDAFIPILQGWKSSCDRAIRWRMLSAVCIHMFVFTPKKRANDPNLTKERNNNFGMLHGS